MSESLRMRVVEAGARAIHEAQRVHFRPDWPAFDDLGDFGQRSAREFMAIAVDAMLDCLTENADEVRAEIYELWAAAPGEPSDMLADLIEVLREPTDG